MPRGGGPDCSNGFKVSIICFTWSKGHQTLTFPGIYMGHHSSLQPSSRAESWNGTGESSQGKQKSPWDFTLMKTVPGRLAVLVSLIGYKIFLWPVSEEHQTHHLCAFLHQLSVSLPVITILVLSAQQRFLWEKFQKHLFTKPNENIHWKI